MIGPSWLIDDMLRVEQMLLEVAGASPHPLVSEPSLHLIKAGGKRLRPALVVVSSKAGEAGRPQTDYAAVAVELVHLATLYHDDVIDETETRRGVPTAHSKWGTDVAVLAGDYLFACGSAMGAEAGGEVPGILARAIAQVCEGQIVETAAVDQPKRSVEDYVATVRLKTAALFRAACELGAVTAGAHPEHRRALARYGENVGLAFQIVDDLLDLVGDPEVTGKVLGTDLKEGVFTAPVLLAAAREPFLAERLEAGVRGLTEILPAISSSGALDESVELARSFARAAHDSLTGLPRADWRDALAMIIEGVLAQVD